jgi:hypothetical protein
MSGLNNTAYETDPMLDEEWKRASETYNSQDDLSTRRLQFLRSPEYRLQQNILERGMDTSTISPKMLGAIQDNLQIPRATTPYPSMTGQRDEDIPMLTNRPEYLDRSIGMVDGMGFKMDAGKQPIKFFSNTPQQEVAALLVQQQRENDPSQYALGAPKISYVGKAPLPKEAAPSFKTRSMDDLLKDTLPNALKYTKDEVYTFYGGKDEESAVKALNEARVVDYKNRNPGRMSRQEEFDIYLSPGKLLTKKKEKPTF